MFDFLKYSKMIQRTLSIAFCCLLFAQCDSRRRLADTVMEDMRVGEIRYLTTLSGTTLHDPKFRLSDRVMASVLAESGQVWKEEKRFEWSPRFFQIPAGMRSYEFLKSSAGTVDMWQVDSTGGLSKQAVPEARYYYRAETASGVVRVQVVLIGELDLWEVGAIFKEEI